MARQRLPRFKASCYSAGNWEVCVEVIVPRYLGSPVYQSHYIERGLDMPAARALAAELNAVLDDAEEARDDK